MPEAAIELGSTGVCYIKILPTALTQDEVHNAIYNTLFADTRLDDDECRAAADAITAVLKVVTMKQVG